MRVICDGCRWCRELGCNDHEERNGVAKVMPRTELKCHCWRPDQPQRDCPRHKEQVDGRY